MQGICQINRIKYLIAMADIYHQFTIRSSPEKVFEAISRSKGLDSWWTKTSSENPEMEGIYTLHFSPGYHWKARVTKFQTDSLFELQITEADEDWTGTRVGFLLNKKNGFTVVDFYHTGWPSLNEHYKISSFCWAMYLRLLKRYVEKSEQVEYEKRLEV
jgi:uncharacterized protein YndB with AHSA1/START domain